MERLSEQVRKVRRWLVDQPFDGILLSEQRNIAWLTGARTYVNLATERSIVFFLITESEAVMYCSNIEKITSRRDWRYGGGNSCVSMV